MLSIDRGREKGKFSSIFLMTWTGLCNESCGTGTFSCFFKGYQEAWHSYFREKFECNTETSVICSTHVSPSSVHIRGLTVPLTLSALFADFSWCLLGLFPFGSVPTSLSLMTVHSLFRSAFLADFALSLPPFPKNLLPQNSCKIDKSFPFRPAHIRRHGARTVTVKRGRADRDNFPNVASILKKAGPNKLQNQTNARTTSPNLK